MPTSNNPVIRSDFPDPDIIRVGHIYYLVSTTMHFFPGGIILKSRDLVNWEVESHIFDRLDSTPEQCLENGNIYGKGMWAASIRYHEGKFYVIFVANDTHKTYLYTAEDTKGPWTKKVIEGFYHDNSLLFDEDKIYIVYGNREIYLRELDADFNLKGEEKLLIRDESKGLGYEGAHIYKIKDRYYIFLIHWPEGHMRTEVVFTSENTEGPWTKISELEDDMGFFGMGVAQGGIVDTPDGRTYAMLFQDHGAVGRIPVLVEVEWDGIKPVFKKPHAQIDIEQKENKLFSEAFDSDLWEWNHEPYTDKIKRDKDSLTLTTFRLSKDIEDAPNTLTQRTFDPLTTVEVTVKGTDLKDGDKAGLGALQGHWAEAALTRTDGRFRFVYSSKKEDGTTVTESADIETDTVTIRAVFDFKDMKDQVSFEYRSGDKWISAGEPHQLRFRLDHFTGARTGLFCYAKKNTGGCAVFSDFRMKI